jgi:GntR family transcriptional regulator
MVRTPRSARRNVNIVDQVVQYGTTAGERGVLSGGQPGLRPDNARVPVEALPDGLIDRSSPVPFHFQLSELLEQEISENRWPRGLRLPSEAELCSHFGVSRSTVRQALARLEQEGLIGREKGRGSYVADTQRRSWLLQSAEGLFQDETERLGRSVTSRILRLERCTLPGWALDALMLPKGAEGVTLERVRAIDGNVALYVVNYLPAWLAEAVLSLKDPNESLYRRLKESMRIEVAGAHRTLEATRAGGSLGKLLELTPGAPVVAIHSVAWDRQHRPFDCYRAWLRTDRLTIEIGVGASPETLHTRLGTPLAKDTFAQMVPASGTRVPARDSRRARVRAH